MRYHSFPTRTDAETHLRDTYEDPLDVQHIGALLLEIEDDTPEWLLLTHLEIDDYTVVRETMWLRRPVRTHVYAVVKPVQTGALDLTSVLTDVVPWYTWTNNETDTTETVLCVTLDANHEPMPTHVARPDRRLDQFGIRHEDEPDSDIMTRFAVFYGVFGITSWFHRASGASRIQYTPFHDASGVVCNLTRSRYQRSLLIHPLR